MGKSRRLTRRVINTMVKVIEDERVLSQLVMENPVERTEHLEKAISYALDNDRKVPYDLLSVVANKVEERTGIDFDLTKYSI